MGAQKKTVSVKWDKETLRMAEDLQQWFSLFVDGRSQMTRLVVKLVHQLVLTEGVQAVVVNHLRTRQHLEQRAAPRDVNTER
jgi:ribonucleotide reductase beta subunit family protein with ferritin-like domain